MTTKLNKNFEHGFIHCSDSYSQVGVGIWVQCKISNVKTTLTSEAQTGADVLTSFKAPVKDKM